MGFKVGRVLGCKGVRVLACYNFERLCDLKIFELWIKIKENYQVVGLFNLMKTLIWVWRLREYYFMA